MPTATWLQRLAPGAAATIAIGTCATWGGIPSAEGNPTGAMSVMDFLGKDYRSAFGLPVINIPGCAPVGDNFTETVFAVLLFLQGLGPLPEFDELGRPAWLFRDTVHHGCTRAGFYEEGIFAEHYGDPECLVEIGCWGPVVNCNIVQRGAINHMGGCMRAGGVCIGCTMPGFPDKFSPFYKTPPGAIVSTFAAKSVGAVVRRLRRLSNREADASTAGTCVRRSRAAGRTCSRRRWPTARSNSSTRLAAPGLEEAGTPAGPRGPVLGRRPPRVSARLPRPERRPGGHR